MKTDQTELDRFIIEILTEIEHTPGTNLDADALRSYTTQVLRRCEAAAAEIQDRYRPRPGQSYGDDMLRMGRVGAENCVNAIRALTEEKE